MDSSSSALLQPPLLPHLPPEQPFLELLNEVNSNDTYGQQAINQAREALAGLGKLKAAVNGIGDEYFNLSSSDPACVPTPQPIPSILPYRRLRSRQTFSPYQSISNDPNGDINGSCDLDTRPNRGRAVLVPTASPPPGLPDSTSPFHSENILKSYLASINNRRNAHSTSSSGISLNFVAGQLSQSSSSSKSALIKVTLGHVGWGYLKFAERRIETNKSGGGKQGEKGKEHGNGKGRLRRMEMVLVRAGMFAPNELQSDKGPTSLSSYRTYIELSTHLTSLSLTLPDLIHRLPSYLTLSSLPCSGCGRILKDGTLPVGRAWRPFTLNKTLLLPARDGTDGDKEMNGREGEEGLGMMDMNTGARSGGGKGMEGEWIAFHMGCWSGVDEGSN